jgi:hypothetical protein
VNLSVNPLTNVSAISTLCLILTTCLPETFGQSMHDDIQDDFLELKESKEIEIPILNPEASPEKLWITRKKSL